MKEDYSISSYKVVYATMLQQIMILFSSSLSFVEFQLGVIWLEYLLRHWLTCRRCGSIVSALAKKESFLPVLVQLKAQMMVGRSDQMTVGRLGRMKV